MIRKTREKDYRRLNIRITNQNKQAIEDILFAEDITMQTYITNLLITDLKNRELKRLGIIEQK
ncbi:hypothetical protein RX880_07990 [Pseudomonas syringae pv. actinidiae]|nr:hypothetical protein [Pseudomonas syringae pv. actinidiae]MDU8099205.1 hypothetical protein [Pseudomonas syringae pv. actinidiae]MDU8115729.1 hypothetical protein [Pseudomonas syringae pv. actinidiae]MDU8131825.1 hypothetical protein [Pseudomonas syringae pv. actinidiae]MDU8153145.1 hypothetical protein [Pseudomonas syringae pv. actinidiae]